MALKPLLTCLVIDIASPKARETYGTSLLVVALRLCASRVVPGVDVTRINSLPHWGLSIEHTDISRSLRLVREKKKEGRGRKNTRMRKQVVVVKGQGSGLCGGAERTRNALSRGPRP